MPAPHCDAIGGFVEDALSCRQAVAVALSELGPDTPPIRAIRFRYGPCDCPEPALCDCAIHYFGTVTFSFEQPQPSGASFRVRPDEQGGYVAVRNPDGVP